ncbi:MAG: hypothetical protein IKW28_03815, partial [Lachnospiraceae bacterium]|nr:hypothetical protein [Lachnospiraceae bacterium]
KNLLKESAAANAAVWYTDKENEENRNFEERVDHLKSWFSEHLTWLDSQMESEDTILSSLGYEASSFTLTVTDSKGEALAKDTVSTIVPADAVAYEGEDLQLTVSSNTITTGNVDIFVNSKKVGTAGLEESFTIASKDLSSALGKKNIIEVKLIGEDKTVKNCITVIEIENPNPPTPGGDGGEVDPTPGGDNNDQPSVPEIEGFRVEIEEDLVYTGKALKPQIMVYDGQTLLKKDKDYKLTYKNNVNAGIAESAEFNSEKPYVIIEGKGNYHGTLNINFAIQKASISDKNGMEAAGVKLSYSDQLEVNSKKDVNPFKSIKLGKNLKKGTDFTLSLIAKETSLNAGTGEVPVEGGLIPKNATGIFELKITGTGNYEGEIIKTVTVFAKDSLLKNAKIKLDSKYKSIDLQTFKTTHLHKLPPEDYQVTMGSESLTEGTHYTATYKNTDSIGTATLVIEGIAPYYGTKTVTFKLTGKKLSNSTLLVEGLTDKDYTGVPVSQEGIKVSYKDRNQAATELVEGTDYTIDYSNHLKKGKATITITALTTSGYQGSVKKTFTIRPQELKDEMKAASMDNITVEYEKAGAKPYDKIILTNNEGQTLVYNQDYTVTYENNKEAGSAAMVVKGKGNYTGSLKIPFTIEKASLSSEKITITLKEVSFNPRKKDNYEYKPGITIKDGNKTLSSKNDYEIIYENNTQEAYKKYYLSEGTDSQLTEADMPRIIIKGRGNYATTEDLVLELPVYRTKLTSKNLYAVILDGNYTGTQSKPEVRLYYSSDNKLVKNARSKGITSEEELLGMGLVKLEPSRYSLSFGTNIFAGPNKGTVKVSGKATEYGGSVTFKFNIKSKEIKTN